MTFRQFVWGRLAGLMLISMTMPGWVAANIVATGNITPAYDNSDPWVVADDLLVEALDNFDGLGVYDGSDVQVGGTTIVGSPNVLGPMTDVYLTGSGSTWVTDGLLVGPHAEGRFLIWDGGVLTSGMAQVGGHLVFDDAGMVTDIIDGTGYVSVTNVISDGSQWDHPWLLLGASGTGSLNIEGGATVNTSGEPDSSALLGVTPDGYADVGVHGEGTTWSVDSALGVGIWGDAGIVISSGAHLNSRTGYVGGMDVELLDLDPEDVLQDFGAADGLGNVTLVDEGSQWNVSEQLVVGGWGQGSLFIADQAKVTVPEMYIGGMPVMLEEEEEFSRDMLPKGTGTVTLTNQGLLEVTGDETLYVGYSGTGTLNVEQSGIVTAGSVVIGGAPDADGTVVVSGGGSTLTAEDMQVGAWGTGHLTVSAGGAVSTSYLSIGGLDAGGVDDLPEQVLEDFGEALGTGIVTVTGNGSLVDVHGTMYVGNYGLGTVDVNGGGYVMTGEVAVGVAPGSHGIITVDGTDDPEYSLSYLEVDGDVGVEGDGYAPGAMIVGGYGEGDVTVSGGGHIALDGDLYVGGYAAEALDFDPATVGHDPDGTGTVTVTGADSLLGVRYDGSAFVYVGYSGVGNLEILDGGQVGSYAALVGTLAGSTGQVTVDGAGSLWEITGSGTGPALSAAGDGEVIISNGGQIIVDGTYGNAILDVAGDITVGSEGSGSNLTVLNAGYVRSHTAGVAVMPDSTGSALVGGMGSEWYNTGSMFVGGYGTGELTVSGGGLVDILDTLYIGGFDAELFGFDMDQIGYEPNGTGTVTVTGEGSTLHGTSLPELYVGYSGDGTLYISQSGYVESGSAIIAMTRDSTGEVIVGGMSEGEGGDASTWENIGSMAVGGYGDGSLLILNGGEVYVGDTLYIGGLDPSAFSFYEELPGFDPNGTGQVTVSGEGSLLAVGADETLHVGYSGEGVLNIFSGEVISQRNYVGTLAESVGVVYVHDGTWTNTGDLNVGVGGHGELWIEAGGQVTTQGPAYLAAQNVGSAYVHVTGEDSLWQMNDSLYVGYNGDAYLNILEGGRVESEEATVGYEVGSLGVVNVAGSDSTWTASEQSIGRTGDGHLTISEGGAVTTNSAILGQMVGGTGEVLVTGSGSRWDIDSILWVGYRGQGELTIADGAYVSSPDGVLGEEATATGTVLVTGESSEWVLGNDLYVGYAGTGIVEVNDGARLVVDESLYVGGDEEGSGGTGTLMVTDDAGVLIGEELYVWETGTLGGDGTISIWEPTTLHNYGTIAPGNNGIGTLTVEGSVVFHEGSTYAVEIDNSSSDKLVVDGGVTIEGGTVRVESQGTILGEHAYEIIQASSVTGEFDGLNTALLRFSFDTIGLDYNDVSVWLLISAASFNDPNVARTYNQRQVAGALQQTAGPENLVTDAVQDIETADQVRRAYDQLSGQTRPPLAPMTIAGTSKFLGTVTSRVQTVQNGLVAGAFDSRLMAMAGPDAGTAAGRSYDAGAGTQTFAVGNGSSALSDRRWGLWGRGYGLYGDRESEGGVPGYAYDIYGGSFGLDYQFTNDLLAGIVGGLSEGDVDFASSRDNTDIEAMHIGLYGSLARNSWYLDSVVTYADLDYESERFVDLLAERLTGDFGGDEIAAYAEVGRSYDLAPNLRLQPLASLQYTHLSLDSYTESGGATALSYDDQTHESIRGSLGARLTRRLIESAGNLRTDLQLRGRWVHEFGDNNSSVDASFVSDPAVVFNVRDEDISRNSAVLGVGLSAEMSKATRVYFDYDTRLNNDESVHVISAAFQYRW